MHAWINAHVRGTFTGGAAWVMTPEPANAMHVKVARTKQAKAKKTKQAKNPKKLKRLNKLKRRRPLKRPKRSKKHQN
ncbi:hypothetical protein [Lactiplantibacillus carotarum]|uniref:hypothetical protein n=1 Tax=Lactiplantibacillus carotarum TaxID=2993456 RepID=UPI00298F2C53|nr:hypothetical protein [Lactiplantibacillus carotarum]